jgi:hypothetical protein
MGSRGKVALGVVVGAVLWAVLWVGGTMAAQSALPELLKAGEPLDDIGPLFGYIGYSVVLSLLAGFVAAAVAGPGRAMRAAWILAFLQLALGVFFEASAWNLTPVWYHLVFLALIVPATVFGGQLKAG